MEAALIQQMPDDLGKRSVAVMVGKRMGVVAELLASRRADVLHRWLEAARSEPFHRGRPEQAIADSMPALFDALVDLLRRHADRSPGVGYAEPSSPIHDAAVLAAARAHAATRFAQGLEVPAIVAEFRLLRQEIGRALRQLPSLGVLPIEAARVESVVDDALDGAVLLALEALGREPPARPRAAPGQPPADELLRLLVERVEDYAIFVLDADGRVASWNAGAERIKGYAANEIIGRPYATFFGEEDRAAGKPDRLLRRARIDGRVEDVGWRVRKDGSRFWADAVLTALYDSRGRLRGYAKVTRDLTERQRAEEQLLVNTGLREIAEARDRALAEAEAERRRLHDLFMQAPAAIAEACGARHEVTFANPLYLRLVGRREPADLIGKPMREALPDMEEQGYFQALDRVYASGEPFVANEVPVRADRRGDGTLEEVFVNLVYQPTRDAGGEVDGILVHAVDVTEQVRARRRGEELAAALQLRSDLIEAAHEAIFAWNSQDGITFWNRGAEELYGYTAEEALGQNTHELLGTPQEQVAAFMAALEQEGRWEGELSHATRAGRQITVEARLALIAGHGRRHILEVTRDVTEQRRAEAALRASQARSAFLAEASRVLGSSLDYQTTLANVAQLAVPGVGDWCAVDLLDEGGELRRLAVAHVDPAKVRLAEELQARYPPDPNAALGPAHVVRTGEPELVHEIPEELLERVVRDAEHLELLRGLGLHSYMVVPVQVRDQIMGAITFVAAESGRRFGPDDLEVADELARRAAVAVENAWLYHQAQEGIRTRDDFLAAASHDLKNPIASIRGNAQLLLRSLERTGGVPPQRLRLALTNVIGSTDQMRRQIDELLDVARLRLGQPLPLDRAPTDLVALTRHAVAAEQATTDRHHIALRTRQAELVGDWDAPRLERVLSNLLSNAVKYSPNGGGIAVDVRREGDEAVLTVQDHGIGIPAADLPRVFDRFERARNVVGRIGGSGIGLAASRQIVEQHGGTIAVESREGQGSSFRVRLPLAAPTRTERAEW